MSRKVREKAGIDWLGDLLEKYGLKLDFATARHMYDDIVDYMSPEVLRTDSAVLQAAWAKMAEAMAILEDGTPVDIHAVMQDYGVNPANKSDETRTRLFLKESGLLQYQGPQREQWVRRINGPTKEA